MGLLQDMQSLLGQGLGALGVNQATAPGPAQSDGALGKLLAPALLGGLAGALMSNKKARQFGAGALAVGGGLALGGILLSKYKDRLRPPQAATPEVATAITPVSARPPAAPADQAGRLIRAVVFAAKSDGHIDGAEQRAIETQLQQLRLGAEADRIVQEALAGPLDPALIADGVRSEEEALELYLVSRAVIDVDHFMEKSYLDALALALNIPPDVRREIEEQAKSAAR